MIVAIVPAAGKSQRMGRSKLLLPLGPRRVIEHVLDALAQSEVTHTIVVVPPEADELCAVVRAHNVEVLRLSEPTGDMRSSVLHALARAEQLWQQSSPDAFLVAPADQPSLSPQLINHLIARFRKSARSIFVPTFNGRRGHPILIAWKHVPHVRLIPPDQGLNHLVARFHSEVEECPVDAAGVLDDLDTPDDYQRLLQRRGN